MDEEADMSERARTEAEDEVEEDEEEDNEEEGKEEEFMSMEEGVDEERETRTAK